MPPQRTSLAAQFQSFIRNLPPSVLSSIMVPADGQQRLVTALFMGMADTTDSECPRRLLTLILETIHRYEGRIDRFLGNGALAVFGTPRAHEDDPERTVLCALELSGAAIAAGRTVSSGISTGQVAFGMMDPDEHHERGVMGQVAQLAVRLQSQAETGAVLIAESTYRHVCRSFDLTPAGGTIRAWRVDRRRPRLEKARGLDGMRAPLVGRDEELARLRDACVEAAGGEGRVVAIVGEAGLGKSRLVAELKAGLLADPNEDYRPLWLEGRCVETGTGTAYGPFIDMLGQHFDGGQGQSGRARRVTETLRSLQASGSLLTDRVDEIGPALGRLLSVRFGTVWDHALLHVRAEQVRHQVVLAVRELLLALARERPLILVLDDLHWADPLSIDLIAALMESLEGARILLVCLYRPEVGARCWRLPSIAQRVCSGWFSEIVLGNLDPAAGLRLIRSLLADDALSSALCGSILAQSQGNPFFIEEVIRSLIDSEALRREGDRWQVWDDAAACAGVPRTLEAVILSRVDRLDPAARRVLETASVIGASFGRRVLELAWGGDGDLSSALDDLERRSLITSAAEPPREEYTFKHVLTQQAVYQGIHRLRRDRLHAKAAAAIEAHFGDSVEQWSEALAWHHEMAGNTEQAVAYLAKAGGRARDSYLNEAATRHFAHARELLDWAKVPAGRPRLDVLVGMGRLHDTMGRLAQAEAAFREAADLARDLGCTPRERARILLDLCHAFSGLHRFGEIGTIGRKMLELLGSDTECEEAVWADIVLAGESFNVGHLRPYCEVAMRRRNLIRSLPYSSLLADACAFLPLPLLLERREPEAMDWLGWVEREAQRHNDLAALAATHVRRGRDILAARGDLASAVEEMGRATELYGRIGARYHEARCHLFAGDLQYRFGHLQPAAECLRKTLALLEQLEQHPHVRAEAALLEGQIAMSSGDAPAALASYQDALASSPGRQWEWFLRLLIGCTLLGQGRKKEAAAQLLMVLDTTLAFRVPPAYAAIVDLAYLLSLLESCDDRGDELRAICALVQRKRPDSRDMLSRWYLEPAEPRMFLISAAGDAAARTWHDPFGDSTREENGGIVIAARPGRGLGGSNLSAPRHLTMAAGDFALQATVGPADEDRPAVGGLVIWKSERDYLRLDHGSFGPESVSFRGCIGNRDVAIGRGRLRAEQVVLRIERGASCVRALCSADGTGWFTLGEAAFAVDDPLDIGLFADGVIRPEIYPRTFSGGSLIRFAGLRAG